MPGGAAIVFYNAGIKAGYPGLRNNSLEIIRLFQSF